MTAHTQSCVLHGDITLSKPTYDFALRWMAYRLRQLRSPNRAPGEFTELSLGLQRLWLDEADEVLRAAADILFSKKIEVVD